MTPENTKFCHWSLHTIWKGSFGSPVTGALCLAVRRSPIYTHHVATQIYMSMDSYIFKTTRTRPASDTELASLIENPVRVRHPRTVELSSPSLTLLGSTMASGCQFISVVQFLPEELMSLGNGGQQWYTSRFVNPHSRLGCCAQFTRLICGCLRSTRFEEPSYVDGFCEIVRMPGGECEKYTPVIDLTFSNYRVLDTCYSVLSRSRKGKHETVVLQMESAGRTTKYNELMYCSFITSDGTFFTKRYVTEDGSRHVSIQTRNKSICFSMPEINYEQLKTRCGSQSSKGTGLLEHNLRVSGLERLVPYAPFIIDLFRLDISKPVFTRLPRLANLTRISVPATRMLDHSVFSKRRAVQLAPCPFTMMGVSSVFDTEDKYRMLADRLYPSFKDAGTSRSLPISWKECTVANFLSRAENKELATKLIGFIQEFVAFVVPEPGKLDLLSGDDLDDRRSLPKHRRVDIEMCSVITGPLPSESDGFGKNDLVPLNKSTRPIVNMDPLSARAQASLYPVLAELVKKCKWYGFVSPDVLRERVAIVGTQCLFLGLFDEDDFSRLDSTISFYLRVVEKLLIERAFNRASHLRCEEIFDSTIAREVKFGSVLVALNSERASGSGDTSICNTSDSACVVYCCNRLAGQIPIVAFANIGIRGGDDGLGPVKDPECWQTVCKFFGLIAKTSTHNFTKLPSFLALTWVGFGTSQVFCFKDVKRAMMSLCTSTKPHVDECIVATEKAEAYLFDNPLVPVVSSFARAIVRVYRLDYRDIKKNVKLKFDNLGYVQYLWKDEKIRPWDASLYDEYADVILSHVCLTLGLTVREVEEIDRAYDTAREMEEFPYAFVLNGFPSDLYKDVYPCIVDGELVGDKVMPDTKEVKVICATTLQTNKTTTNNADKKKYSPPEPSKGRERKDEHRSKSKVKDLSRSTEQLHATSSDDSTNSSICTASQEKTPSSSL